MVLSSAAPGVGAAQSTANGAAATLLTGHDLGVLGVASLGTVALSAFDARLADRFADSSFHARYPGIERGSRRASVFTETVFMISGGLVYGLAHATTDRMMEDVALHTTAAVIGGAMSIQVVRGLLGRARPFVVDSQHVPVPFDQYHFHLFKGFSSYDYRAFPSMHAMASFAVASALAQEMRYRDAPGRRVTTPLLYAAAAFPGVSRLFLDEHWASDVALGAVIGVLAGQVAVGYTHAHTDNRLDRRFLRAGIVSSNGRLSLTLLPSGP